MKLVVPYVGELGEMDARMVRLAEFLGMPCQTLALPAADRSAESLARIVPQACTCLVVNPQVLKQWLGPEGIPDALVSFLLSRFKHVIVYGLRVDAFDDRLIAALSRGGLKSVNAIDGPSSTYTIAKDSKDICDVFAGLSFGPANPANDRVMSLAGSDPAVRQLISIGGKPFMATVKTDGAEVLFIGSEDVADVNAEIDHGLLADHFSRLVPAAMALRYVAGDECWRPATASAAFIIDDPLLRNSYGFLNFESLLRLEEQHNFHTVIAFIPHNFRRNSTRITRMFQQNSSRLSICFHGNDHTQREFASSDPVLLNTLLHVAERRMNSHQQATGLACDKVMVFPQEKLSVEALRILQSHNFQAAVTSNPRQSQGKTQLTVGDFAQPALLQCAGFPLFIRKRIRQIQTHDIAFNFFFGRPVLIFDHHELFENPEILVEVVAKINSIEPRVHWCNLAAVAANSFLVRRGPGGAHHVRAYSNTVRISNGSEAVQHFSIEWDRTSDGATVDQVLMDGTPCRSFEIDDSELKLSLDVPPGTSRTLSLVHRNDQVTVRRLGYRWKTRAFVRRRLSEFRDNHLSKHQGLLTVAKAFQRRFLKV